MSLFKYMSDEVAPLFANTLRVRFTQPSDLNDPFEFRPLIDFDATAVDFGGEVEARINAMFNTVDGILDIMERQQRTDPNFPKMVVPIRVFRQMVAANPKLGQQFLVAMDQHKAELMAPIKKALEWEVRWEKFQGILGQIMGIFSLTEDPAHMLMWSHYAAQHRGIVVEFDETNPWFDQKLIAHDEFRHLRKVAYIQNPHPRSWKQMNDADLLYTKNAEWAYEREWRIIRPLKDGNQVSPGKFCFAVPANAIRGIIFGCRIAESLEKDLRAAVAANPQLAHLGFKRVKLGGGKLELIGA